MSCMPCYHDVSIRLMFCTHTFSDEAIYRLVVPDASNQIKWMNNIICISILYRYRDFESFFFVHQNLSIHFFIYRPMARIASIDFYRIYGLHVLCLLERFGIPLSTTGGTPAKARAIAQIGQYESSIIFFPTRSASIISNEYFSQIFCTIYAKRKSYWINFL